MPAGAADFFIPVQRCSRLWWAVAPVGFDAFLDWGVRREIGMKPLPQGFLNCALIVLSLLLSTAALFYQNVYMAQIHRSMAWRAGYDRYWPLNRALAGLGVKPTDVLMVNNPPGCMWLPAVIDGCTGWNRRDCGYRGTAFWSKYFLLDENTQPG
jgi:hypothetical protein